MYNLMYVTKNGNIVNTLSKAIEDGGVKEKIYENIVSTVGMSEVQKQALAKYKALRPII